MNTATFLPTALLALHLAIQVALMMRILLRPHRDPASRIAWVVVVMALPVVGILSYLLLGEVNIGRRRIERMRQVLAGMPSVEDAPGADAAELKADVPERHAHLFRVGQSISGFAPLGGNRAQLPEDSDAVIDALVADIDHARDHVHLLFYIWLPDKNGLKVASALMRAAARGVTCRAMADDLGSRRMIRSEHWRAMEAAGVRLARALPIGNPILRALGGRIDLRNHRKIVVIDDDITYCGSQNCADPAFTIKAKYAPWVDAMIRFEGPIARQNQHLFASDWMAIMDDDIAALLHRPLPPTRPGLAAQVIGTGPTVRYSAMPEMFETLIYSARRELVITTPYYVPVESMQAALCASARRGVDTSIVFPARNDSWVVSAASRSYYADLLAAGVRIHEYVGGLLHTKSLTLDGEISLIGSANMDRRSFELNYENNILFYDTALTADLRQRQQSYIDKSVPIDPQSVARWTRRHRLWNNAIAMLGPVL
ncbi:cardiolipin synthase [Thiorhodococcus mannitoliphagus]|uniref:Cardiolipin synthase n=1 Tax=Thiorhodococcus mannitoliphagus TaxID=329406 RepID=A0A6P1DVB6_9GAMM|nr:cardiolipin synthase [Thiorhodococcus mannitoliphagus]NEX20002.1 cardiolipin synthase [Thiorhodococcus mannitoliphagus]